VTPSTTAGWSPSAWLTALGVASFVVATLQASGAYYALAGGIAGGLLVIVAGMLLISGRRPSTPVAAFAVAVVLLGSWSVASTAWGGLPHVAWRFLGLTISLAAAAVAASCVATSPAHRQAVVAGVGAGVAVHAALELVVVATHTAPESWYYVRYFDGPVGYHNAESAALLLGLPIAVWAGASAHRYLRSMGAATAALLVGTILLTQSRGAILAAALSAITQIAVSRRLRVAALWAALGVTGVVLFFPLKAVDRALVAGDTKAHALSAFVAYTCVSAIVLGALSIPNVRVARRPTRRHALVASVAGVVVLAIVAATSAAALGNRFEGVAHRLNVEPNSTQLLPGGETRLASVAPSGRFEQWRMAARMAAERPAAGHGAGTFAARWGRDRTIDNEYVLQPHSLELELAAELGVVGILLGLGAVISLGLGIARGIRLEHAIGAVAAATAVGFLAQASIDWVFSFPAVAAPLVAVAGVASPGSLRTPGTVRTLAYGAAVLLGVFALSGPALAAFDLQRARDAGPRQFASAWSSVRRARSFDRWDPAAASYEGILAESAGRYVVAASLYARAAELAQQPWVDTYRQARALKRAGLVKASRAACRRAIAADPLERGLRTGVCKDVD
jgi:hypothetical protein